MWTRAILYPLMVIPLTACDNDGAEQAAHDRFRKAITRAVCSDKGEELKFALGDVAVSAAGIPEPVREGMTWQLADEVKPEDCRR